MPGTGTATIVGAGDIALCGGVGGSTQTAALLDQLEGTVFTAGDNVYQSGTAEEYANCYAPTWGRHLNRTRPSPGNHDWKDARGLPYFDYFGERAGPPGRGYYSFNLGAWHLISLNSNVDVRRGSAQERWLREDLLAARNFSCVLAYFHHPLFTSGSYGMPKMKDIWVALYESRADVVISGHDHVYERFTPQNPEGSQDLTHGIRQFTVGTGGAGFTSLGLSFPSSEASQDHTYGVLTLELQPGAYSWRFVPIAGKTFSDSGSGNCVQ